MEMTEMTEIAALVIGFIKSQKLNKVRQVFAQAAVRGMGFLMGFCQWGFHLMVENHDMFTRFPHNCRNMIRGPWGGYFLHRTSLDVPL